MATMNTQTAQVDPEVQKLMQELHEQAEAIRNDSAHSMQTMEIGDEWRQGDVRVRRISDEDFQKLMPSLSKIENFNGKVAPGSTIGSQHMLSSLTGVVAYQFNKGNPLDGPVIKTSQPLTLGHPEHGDCVDLPAGIYACPGQRVYAEEIRRTRD